MFSIRKIKTTHIKRIAVLCACLLVGSVFIVSNFSNNSNTDALSGSQFKKDRIIDDIKFYRTSSMTVSQIQSFLNGKVPVCDTLGQKMHSSGMTRAEYGRSRGESPPYTCIKSRLFSTQSKAAVSGQCSALSAKSNQTTARIIYDVSNACGVDSKVLLVMLQKEQGLITDDWPWRSQLRIAMGYGCPDDAPCDQEYYGFFNQIYNAARQLKNYRQNPDSFSYAAGRTSFVAYQANAPSCGGTNITMQNAATAALYNYTPYQPNKAALDNLYGSGNSCSAYGNRNFWRMYNDWFGPTIVVDQPCARGTNVSDADDGNNLVGISNTVIFTASNNTGSTCIEAHTLNPALSGWSAHVPTNHISVDPSTSEVISGDTNGDGREELLLIKYQSTGSGKIEVHTWKASKQSWSSNVATNHSAISLGTGRVIAGDMNGDGKDELLLIKYQSTGSGKIEVHTWKSGYKSWASNIATNHNAALTTTGRVIAGDTNGDGKDELMFVRYQTTGSGKIEIHKWRPGYKSWASNIATNHAATPTSRAEVIVTNRFPAKKDEIALALFQGTGSGKTEVHTWRPGSAYKGWLEHRVTALGYL